MGVRVMCCSSRTSGSAPQRGAAKGGGELRRPNVIERPVFNATVALQPGGHLGQPVDGVAADEAEATELCRKVVALERHSRVVLAEDTAEALAALDAVFQRARIMNNAQFMTAAEMLGTICLKSSLSPVDSKFRRVVDHLSESLEHRIPYLCTTDLCLLVWVYGCFGPSVLLPRLFRGVRQLVSQICMRVEGDHVHSVKDTVRLFSGLQRMQFSPRKDVTHQTLRKLVPVLRHQEICVVDLAKSVILAAKLKVPDGVKYLRSAGRLVRDRFGEFPDRSLLEFVMGFAIYDIKMQPGLFDSFAAELSHRLERMDLSVLIQILLNLSKIQYLPSTELLQRSADRILSEIITLNPGDISDCVHAMGQLDFCFAELMAALGKRFAKQAGDMDSVQICHALIGFTRLDVLTEDVLFTGLRSLTPQLTTELQKPQRMIIHQVLTHAKLFLEPDVISPELFPQSWQDACRDEWVKDQRRPMFAAEASVVKTAQLLGMTVTHTETAVGDISIYVLSCPEKDAEIAFDLVIEKQHCFMNRKEKVLPWKQWQKRVVEAQGMEVVSLIEMQWIQVPTVSKMRHLGRKLGLWTVEEIVEMEDRVGIRKRDN